MVPLVQKGATTARSGCSAGNNHCCSSIVLVLYIAGEEQYLSRDFVKVKSSPCL